MSYARFEIRDMLTCAATDEEGFRCVRSPNHGGEHEWGRCPYVDEGGHRCFMPLRHPGRHVLPWFDSPAHDGDRHTVRYEGSEDECRRRTLRDMPVFERHGWVARDTTFTMSWPWRLRPLERALAALLLAPRGHLDAVYEFHPGGVAAPSEG